MEKVNSIKNRTICRVLVRGGMECFLLHGQGHTHMSFHYTTLVRHRDNNVTVNPCFINYLEFASLDSIRQ